MDPWVGDQVGLKLGHINIQGTIKPQRGGQGGNHLNQTTKISAQGFLVKDGPNIKLHQQGKVNEG